MAQVAIEYRQSAGSTPQEIGKVSRPTLLENSRQLLAPFQTTPLGRYLKDYTFAGDIQLPRHRRSQEKVRTDQQRMHQNMGEIFGAALMASYLAPQEETRTQLHRFGFSPDIQPLSFEHHGEGIALLGQDVQQTRDSLVTFGANLLTHVAGYHHGTIDQQVTTHLGRVVDSFFETISHDSTPVALVPREAAQATRHIASWGESLLTALNPQTLVEDLVEGNTSIMTTLAGAATPMIGALSVVDVFKGNFPDAAKGLGWFGLGITLTLASRAIDIGVNAGRNALASRR